MFCKKISTLKNFPIFFSEKCKTKNQHCLGGVGGVFISGQLRSVRIYLSTPEISLDTKIDRTWHTAEKTQTPGKLLRLLYIRTLRNSSAPVLSKAITTRRCARKEDRSKPEPDRSKPGRMCALAWSRASARGRRRCSSGAAPGVATENSCFP